MNSIEDFSGPIPKQWLPEHVAAWADGELPSAWAKELEDEMTRSPELAEMGSVMMLTKAHLHSMKELKPQLVGKQPLSKPFSLNTWLAQMGSWINLNWQPAAAMSLVTGVIGLVVGQGLQSDQQAVGQLLGSSWQSFLSTTVQGKKTELNGTVVVVVASYQTSNKQFCREMQARSLASQSGESVQAIVCQNEQKHWNLVAANQFSTTDQGYQPASDQNIFNAKLREIGATALSIDQEKNLLAKPRE
jgi:hypothetical protein